MGHPRGHSCFLADCATVKVQFVMLYLKQGHPKFNKIIKVITWGEGANVNPVVVLEDKSGDHRIQMDISSGNHEC